MRLGGLILRAALGDLPLPRCFRDTQTGGSTAMCSDVLSSEKKWSTRVGAMSQHMGDAVAR